MATNTIELKFDDQTGQSVDIDQFQQLANLASVELELPPSITLRFVGKSSMQRMNKYSSGNDYVTDVLSINYAEATDLLPNEVPSEIVICPEAAASNAKKAHHGLVEELKLLFVHGLVHIAGYDHADTESKVEFDKIVSGIIEKAEKYND